ncbi:OpgC domain-containing protein [Agromyces subbeticus]|uniref:OpgC domain-containing protein n=1 Tax=Agromyces subbeticus TaxID=293890 RepID=UPI0003FC3C49|nr:OpgC domain-containing protein [Agromyces subbeticus]
MTTADGHDHAPPAAEVGARRPRIVAFDLLRGFFLFVIITNHLHFEPNLVELVTGRGALPASAAEGFYLVSGIMVGYVHLPSAARDGLGLVWIRVWRRALLIYAAAVLLVLMRLVVLHLRGNPLSWDGVVDVLLLGGANGQPADFLALYAVAMLFAPFVIWAALHRLEWIAVLIAGVPWAVTQSVGGLAADDTMKLAWPLLFTIGIVFGCRWPEIIVAWRRRSAATRRAVEVGLIVILVVSVLGFEFVIFWNHHILVASADRLPGWFSEFLFGIERAFLEHWTWFEPWQAKATLAPGRLVIGAIWFAGLLFVARRWGPALDRALGGLFTTYGRHTLAGYVLHLVLIWCVYLPTVSMFVRDAANPVLNTLVVIATQVIMVAMVRAWVELRRAARSMLGRGRDERMRRHPLQVRRRSSESTMRNQR